MIYNIITHFKLWNRWRKNCTNSIFHKFLVLFGLCYSPTFDFMRSTISLSNASYAYDKLSNSMAEASKCFSQLGVSMHAAIDADEVAKKEFVRCLKERGETRGKLVQRNKQILCYLKRGYEVGLRKVRGQSRFEIKVVKDELCLKKMISFLSTDTAAVYQQNSLNDVVLELFKELEKMVENNKRKE